MFETLVRASEPSMRVQFKFRENGFQNYKLSLIAQCRSPVSSIWFIKPPKMIFLQKFLQFNFLMLKNSS